MACGLCVVAVGPASPFWPRGLPGPDPGPDSEQGRALSDCCPYALLNGDPRQPRETLVLPISHQACLGPPANPTQPRCRRLFPWVHQLFDQLF